MGEDRHQPEPQPESCQENALTPTSPADPFGGAGRRHDETLVSSSPATITWSRTYSPRQPLAHPGQSCADDHVLMHRWVHHTPGYHSLPPGVGSQATLRAGERSLPA